MSKVLGIITAIIGFVMCVFAWLFWFNDYSIEKLASLYIALAISCLVMACGFIALGINKRSN